MNPLDEQIKLGKRWKRSFKRAERDCIKANTEYVIAREKLLILRDEAKRLFTPSCPTCKNYERKGEPVRYNCHDCAHFDPDKSCSPCHWDPKIEPGNELIEVIKNTLNTVGIPSVGMWAEKPEEKPEGNCETCVSRFRPGHLEPCVNCTRLPKAICTKANRMDHYKEKTT